MRLRRQRGGSIAEFAAAISLLIPILVGVVVCAWQASYAYSIHTAMDAGARRAARDLAIEYGKTGSIPGDIAPVLNRIRISHMINHNDQFNVNWQAQDVTVTCEYKNIPAWGLPPFPNPDPLGLGATFVSRATATYRLE